MAKETGYAYSISRFVVYDYLVPKTSHTKKWIVPILFLMFRGIEYDFCLLRVWIPGAVSGNCLVTNGLREVWLLCCFDVRWTCLPVLASGRFRYFKGHFRTRWCLRCVFCSVMHHCVVRRSGSVPTEITEPALEARSSRHVFIETLQSKDFPASLLICGNFQITAFRVHSS